MRPIVEIYFYPRPPRGGRHNSLNGWATDIKFLSTPSARRATKRVTQKGGDRRFLSTPSARRATSRRAIRSLMGAYFYPRPPRGGRPTRAAATDSTEPISIHALREEGDCRPWTGGSCRYDFYPCPPRGGRLGGILYGGRGQGISIHALREEGDSPYRPRRALRTNFYPRPPRGGRLFGRLKQRRKKPISIHALREEGDRTGRVDNRQEREFLSTPSARRATTSMAAAVRPRSFLSTPSARRATITDRAVRYLQTISIHALREEGDVCAIYDISELISFLSTPSARRATERSGPQEAQEAISIHALREEGDPRRQHRRPAGLKISIHALREEGDAEFAVLHQVTEISIHALREEGDFFNK